MANLQVKSIDDDLYESLGRRAAMENRSISQEVVSILKAYLSSPHPHNTHVNSRFLELCGTWQDSRSAEAIAEDIVSSRRAESAHREFDF